MLREKSAAEPGFSIRAFLPQDARAASAILEEATEAARWSLAALQQMLSLRGAVAWMAEYEGTPTGFIVGRQVADEGEILNLTILTAYRRKGAGRALVQQILEAFAKRGVVKVFLEVRESNIAAVSFYESLGFRKTGRREGYYREPPEAALILEKMQ
jgi:[ribosomal protein S18]-alanine N-acetyltransferase